ncbi:MAG: hypothetical protein AAF558_09590 [Verrucomicrobiota bacterium]
MNTIIVNQRKTAVNKDRLAYLRSQVNALTHAYIQLGMSEPHAYASALADFEIDYSNEVDALKNELSEHQKTSLAA